MLQSGRRCWACAAWMALAALFLAAGVASGATLLTAGLGETVVLHSPGLSSGKASTADITLVRVDPYAQGARLWLVKDGTEPRRLPRSTQRFFVPAARRLDERVYLVLEPEASRFHSVVFTAGGGRRYEGVVEDGRLVVQASRPVSRDPSTFRCAVEAGRAAPTQKPMDVADAVAMPKAAMYGATVAVDTDVELMAEKFGNNTTAATNYLAQLFVGMNVFYERDIDVRLMQGDTFLRVGSDSYVSSDVQVQLNEVGTLWKDTPALAALSRAFVMLLSGKNPSPNGASGIAWLLESGSYCAAKGTVFGGDVFGHYSATQVFTFAGSTAANDVSIVGHELGHNFGAAHTHCTNASGAQPASSNTIDRCTNIEAGLGCYGGAVSCPTDNSVSGRGSIMSYCNYGGSGSAGCGAVLQEFHPVHQGVLDARVQTNVLAGCLTPLVVPPTCTGTCIFRHSFE
jgi:hypothetical protein